MEETLEKLRHNLIVLPGAPLELQSLNPAVNFLLGKAKTVRTLYHMNLHGLVVSEQVPLNLKGDNNAGASASQQSPEKVSHGCLFIPAPKFDKVIVIKNVSSLSNDDSVSRISNSVLDQIHHLNNLVHYLKQNAGLKGYNKLVVQFLVCHPNKLTEHTQFACLKSAICSQDAQKNCSNLDLSIDFIRENNLETKVLKCIKETTRQTKLVENLISHCINTIPQAEMYHLSKLKFNLLSKKHETFEQIDEVIQLFDFYFPDRHQKLLSVPHFNRIEDHMLYAYTNEGELGKFCDYAGYLGEVRLFSEKLLANLKSPTGILLKNFSNDHLNEILDFGFCATQQFEIDWLYLGAIYIVAFEVGMSENPQLPRSAICNKIEQTIEKTIPQMQMILYSLLVPYNEKRNQREKCSFDKLIQKMFKVIVFLPNITLDSLVTEFKLIRELCQSSKNDKKLASGGLQKIKTILNVLKNKQQICSSVLFLVEDKGQSNGLKLVRLAETLEIVDSDCSLEEFFSCTDSVQESLLKFLCSMFSFARLKSIENTNDKTVLEVDDRYKLSRKKVSQEDNEQKAETSTGILSYSNFVLSPQQHRILSDNSKTHLVITGQPGTGKTTLLLAKAEELARSEEVTKIHFFYDKLKKLYGKFLRKLYLNCCSGETKEKITFVPIDTRDFERWISGVPDVVTLHLFSFCSN